MQWVSANKFFPMGDAIMRKFNVIQGATFTALALCAFALLSNTAGAQERSFRSERGEHRSFHFDGHYGYHNYGHYYTQPYVVSEYCETPAYTPAPVTECTTCAPAAPVTECTTCAPATTEVVTCEVSPGVFYPQSDCYFFNGGWHYRYGEKYHRSFEHRSFEHRSFEHRTEHGHFNHSSHRTSVRR
jgi:hypothetical protein